MEVEVCILWESCPSGGWPSENHSGLRRGRPGCPTSGSAIAREIPEIAPHLRHAAVGMGTELLPDDALLRPDAEISLLPPVSGG